MRLVSLTCSNTEIVCALGCAELLVGVDDHSDHPAEVVSRLPRVGKDLTVDPEKVRALRPDLVLASLTVPGHEKVVSALAAQRDLNLLVLSPQSLSDVRRDIALVARVLGVPQRAEPLCAELEPTPAPAGPRPRLLVEWWPRPCIAAGRRSWVQDLIVAAGGQNALDEDCTSRPLAPGEVDGLRPDAIVISWCGVPERSYRPEVVLRREGWAQVPAVQRGAVHPITEAWLGRPGPRLVEGLRALRAVVQACGG